MAVVKPVFLFSCVFLILVLLSESAEGFPNSKTSSRTKQKRKTKVKLLKANLGAACKLRCKLPSKTSDIQWFKDGHELNITKSSGYRTKKRSKQKFELLKIMKVSKNHCGLFECRVKNTDRKLGAWRIDFAGGKGAKCKREKRGADKNPVCGKAGEGTYCEPPIFPMCKSFAGLPRDINTKVFVDKGKAVVQIGWKPPVIGYNDLWGYQLHIVGKKGHSGHYRCVQINSKDEITYHTFSYIFYGAVYELRLQSMPSKKMFKKEVYVKEKCDFDEFKFQPSCCVASDVNSTVSVDRGAISLSWGIRCANQSININSFRVMWTNLQMPIKCSGVQTIQDASSKNSRFNYSILLSEECQQHNYSIKVMGIHDSNKGTRTYKLTVSYPQKIPEAAAKTVLLRNDDTKIFVAVSGVIFGLALVALFFIYKYCFTKVVIKLPNPSQRLSDSSDHSPQTGEPLLDEGIKRAFLMSPRCCDQCKWVVHCLGKLLTSTGMVEVRADLWSEIEISHGVLRWYEEEIRQANCVVILASRRMARWNQLRTVASDEDNGDLLDITAQLNLVSGEITRDPNSPKFIPAYFNYSGEPKDIPDFLSSRLAHKLPNDLNRLIYHVLNIEAIQPYRTRPIVVLGGDDHPFESRKEDLLRAIKEAEEEHVRLENENNNSSIVA